MPGACDKLRTCQYFGFVINTFDEKIRPKRDETTMMGISKRILNAMTRVRVAAIPDCGKVKDPIENLTLDIKMNSPPKRLYGFES